MSELALTVGPLPKQTKTVVVVLCFSNSFEIYRSALEPKGGMLQGWELEWGAGDLLGNGKVCRICNISISCF